MDDFAAPIPLDGFAMHLRRPEIESVSAGLSGLHASARADAIALVEALRNLPANDRAPAWELAVRRYGRRKPLALAAAEIGTDVVLASDLLQRFSAPLITTR